MSMRTLSGWLLSAASLYSTAWADQADLTAVTPAASAENTSFVSSLHGALPRWWANLESRALAWLDDDDVDVTAAAETALAPPAWLAPTAELTSANVDDTLGYEEDPLLQAATYRSSGAVYFKGKAGYLNLADQNKEDLFSQLSFTEMVTEIDSRRAFGVGAGYRIGRSERLEFEYVVNKHDEQVFNVGYTF